MEPRPVVNGLGFKVYHQILLNQRRALPAMPGARKAKSALTFMESAKARAEVALEAAIVKLVPVTGRMRSEGFRHGGDHLSVDCRFPGWTCAGMDSACAL
jgi:hypothetical protein